MEENTIESYAWSSYGPYLQYRPNFASTKAPGVSPEMISDGMSNTVLLGEKHIPPNKLGVGWFDCSTFNGDYYTCNLRPSGKFFPWSTNQYEEEWKFGSYHFGKVPFAMADGSVRSLSTATSEEIQHRLGSRNDGEVIPDF
ncbi:MAG: DUF1559 domain-containing protein [Gemmataceae bacterium]